VQGHLWTIVPHVRDMIRPPKAHGHPWRTELEDPSVGTIQLTGILSEVPGADRCVVIVHGMGGNARKGYVTRLARYANEMGLSALRLNLRGADQHGQDIYHGGLVADMTATVTSPELAKYQHLHGIGFSLGGHMAASYARDADPRMRSVAALCAPIDLDAACDYIDHPKRKFYRWNLLTGLRGCVDRLDDSRSSWLDTSKLSEVKLMRVWDDMVTAPRFGFSSASEMYRNIGVGGHLEQLAIPTLFVFAKDDPMVTGAAIAPALTTRNPHITVRHVPGGHVHMPAKARVLRDSLKWLVSHG
jgi:predicted alpha/beta-fold hydrolase